MTILVSQSNHFGQIKTEMISKTLLVSQSNFSGQMETEMAKTALLVPQTNLSGQMKTEIDKATYFVSKAANYFVSKSDLAAVKLFDWMLRVKQFVQNHFDLKMLFVANLEAKSS